MRIKHYEIQWVPLFCSICFVLAVFAAPTWWLRAPGILIFVWSLFLVIQLSKIAPIRHPDPPEAQYSFTPPYLPFPEPIRKYLGRPGVNLPLAINAVYTDSDATPIIIQHPGPADPTLLRSHCEHNASYSIPVYLADDFCAQCRRYCNADADYRVKRHHEGFHTVGYCPLCPGKYYD